MSTRRPPSAGLPYLTAEEVLHIGKSTPNEESPINLSFDIMEDVRVSGIEWENFDVTPKLMKISNSGLTAIVSGKWDGKRPFLADGPLMGKYVFSQLHFHWGRSFQEGSEHRIDGEALPLEAHIMFFKNLYVSQDEAMKKIDGTVTIAYFFKEEDNEDLDPIINVLPSIANPLSSEPMKTIPLQQFAPPFQKDYFMYWGSILRMSVLWLISRRPIGISRRQLAKFKILTDINHKPLEKNYRMLRELNFRVVYHVNPSNKKAELLLPIDGERLKAKVQDNYHHISDEREGQDIHNYITNLNKEKPFSQNPTYDDTAMSPLLNIINYNLAKSPNVKDLKCKLAQTLLELEKNENNDLSVLENYIKAKYQSMSGLKMSCDNMDSTKPNEQSIKPLNEVEIYSTNEKDNEARDDVNEQDSLENARDTQVGNYDDTNSIQSQESTPANKIDEMPLSDNNETENAFEKEEDSCEEKTLGHLNETIEDTDKGEHNVSENNDKEQMKTPKIGVSSGTLREGSSEFGARKLPRKKLTSQKVRLIWSASKCNKPAPLKSDDSRPTSEGSGISETNKRILKLRASLSRNMQRPVSQGSNILEQLKEGNNFTEPDHTLEGGRTLPLEKSEVLEPLEPENVRSTHPSSLDRASKSVPRSANEKTLSPSLMPGKNLASMIPVSRGRLGMTSGLTKEMSGGAAQQCKARMWSRTLEDSTERRSNNPEHQCIWKP